MTNQMMRSSIFDDLISLPEAVNSLFENSFLKPSWTNNFTGISGQPLTALNIYEDNAHYYVLGLFPGINPDQLELNVKENVLSIGGEYAFNNWLQTQETSGQGDTATQQTKPEVRTLLVEIPQGRFYRQVQLPGAFNFDKIEARYEDGLLKLVLPKAESSQVKRITVQAGNKQLSGQTQPQLNVSNSKVNQGVTSGNHTAEPQLAGSAS